MAQAAHAKAAPLTVHGESRLKVRRSVSNDDEIQRAISLTCGSTRWPETCHRATPNYCHPSQYHAFQRAPANNIRCTSSPNGEFICSSSSFNHSIEKTEEFSARFS